MAISTAPAKELPNQEANLLAVKILRLLDGLPLYQALSILEHKAVAILKTGQRFDTASPEFVDLVSRLEADPSYS